MLSWIRRLVRGAPAIVTGVDQLPEGQSRVVALGDPLAGATEIVLSRVGGRLCAVDRRCPHEGGHISGGPLVEGRWVQCPLHNFKFDPTSGKAVGAICRNAKVYRVRERDGSAEIWV